MTATADHMAVTYVLRHGRTELSARYVVNGDPALPVHLDPVGVAQCRRLAAANWLPSIATCLVSQFPRARQTAALVLGSARPVVVTESRLNEIDYGVYEGRPWMDYGAWLRRAGTSEPPPGGESRDAAVGRMLAALLDCLGLPGPRLVVGHGLMISALHQLLGGGGLNRWDLPDPPYVEPIRLTDQLLRQLVASVVNGWAKPPRPHCLPPVSLKKLPKSNGDDMHDPRHLLDPEADAVRRLSRRSYSLDTDRLQGLVSSRSQAIQATDEARAEAKRLAAGVQSAARAGTPTAELADRARSMKIRIQELEAELGRQDAALQGLLLEIPNLPEDRCPDGDSDEFATEVRREGSPPVFEFDPRDHVDLGERLGILDFAAATKLSGPRFAVIKGAGAVLERALTSFFLALHTGRHGYVEHSVPSLVSRKTMTGTGQLPKFEQDLFKTSVGDRELFLIPTAEVPLTNLYAGATLRESDLPIALTAHTPCFRSEAGSYGRDTRGLIRMHEFSKVELVRICRPEDSSKELEIMLGHAESCLRELGLAYRVVALAAGDIGFAAQFTYDLEVWIPSQNRYREISSVSDCSTFQGRRAGIRYTDTTGKRIFAATLNGSGLPIGRSLVAVLEQYQEHDGSIRVPEVLVPYTGFRRILADGTTE